MITFPRRRYTAIAAVAVAATVLFGVGYAIGGRDSPAEPVQTIAMNGPGGATASIALLPKDAAGNWPMTLEVSGLPPLPDGRDLHALADEGRQARRVVRLVRRRGRDDDGAAQRAVPR